MNARQLAKLGVPESCIPKAIPFVQAMAAFNNNIAKENKIDLKSWILFASKGEFYKINESLPDNFILFGDVLNTMKVFVDAVKAEEEFVRPEPISYQTWGDDIDQASHDQMKQACSMPNATGAALMPDAHLGYGLPIGGVLALDNAVCPFAVGVDIACRMKLSILDLPYELVEDDSKSKMFIDSLNNGTRFGLGCNWQQEGCKEHNVMDDNRWRNLPILNHLKDTAMSQLGTSGGGNHFVEFGILTVDEEQSDLGLPVGRYLALMSHSGSRGPGSKVCNQYSGIARDKLPKRYKDLGRLAWLDLDSEAGQEYWMAMNLMGDFAAANHDVIHRTVSNLVGAEIIAGVENHHNFAWIENHNGKDVIVHRKGATPASNGQLGVIPGSMATPAFVVRGKGNEASLRSASHGAGRVMSRTKAKEQFNLSDIKNYLRCVRGVTVIGSGADEVPGVYKNIHEVMAAQTDLVEAIARFDPKIVRMSDDGSAED